MSEQKKKPTAKKVYAKNYYIPGVGHVKAGAIPTASEKSACKKAGIDIEKLLK